MKLRSLLLFVFVAALLPAQPPQRQHLKSKEAQEHHLPFSSGVLVGNTLYIAGTTGVGPSTKGPVSPEDEARMVMDNVKQVVEQAGMTMDDLVSFQVYCTDLKLYDTFNGVYKTYFKGDFPARAFLGTSTLLFNAKFEVTGIAIRAEK